MEEQKKALQFKELTPEESILMSTLFDNENQQASVRIGPKGYAFVKEYEKYAADIYNMELRSGDIFVASYQRSGTTWIQELVWLVANELDYKTAGAVPLSQRYPFLEQACFFSDKIREEIIERGGNTEKVRQVVDFLAIPSTTVLAGMPSPRFVKTHLPMCLLPPKLLDTAKVLYVARDPRDVIVSSYHHGKLFKHMQFKASFKELWTAFKKDLFILTPYFEHVKEAWVLRDHPNMLFLFYEDLSKDLPASIRRVAAFLGKELTPEQMERLCDHLSIENFKKNSSVNYEDVREMGFLDSKETFIRNGKTGGWRDYFDEEMQREADRWITENLQDTDLRFPSMEHV